MDASASPASEAEEERAAGSSPASPLGPRPLVLARLALLLGPLALLLIGGKVQKYLALAPSFAVLDLLSVLAQDLLLLTGLAAGFALAMSAGSRWMSPAATVLLHVIAPVMTVMAVIEHGFFTVTGAIGDGFILADALSRIGELAGVIRSEITAVRGAALVGPLLLSPAVALALRTRRLRERLSAGGPPRLSDWRRAPYAVLVGVMGASVLAGTAFAPRNVPDALSSLRPSFYVAIGRDWLALLHGPGEEGLAELVEPVEPVRLIRGGEPRAKNVILVVLESVGAKHTTVYDDKLETTPYLARLAKRGAAVEEAYTVTPHTSKALVAIQCGTYPKLTPTVAEAKLGGIPAPCLARLLREEGYATAYFQPAEEHYERRSELVREFGFQHYAGKESIDGAGFDESSYFGWEDDAMLAPVLDWVDAQDGPFFASVLTLTAHHPYALPRGFPRRRFAEDRELNDYLNTVAYTDRFVGKLFTALEQRGRWDDTLLIVVGDHGEAFGEHGRYQHDSVVYEETIRVPLVLAGAGIRAGTRVSGLRQQIDILPTVVEHLGFAPDAPLLGRSLLSTPGHEQLFFNCYYHRYCMGLRRGPLKIVHNYGRRADEVYDLSRDRLERTNLLPEDPALQRTANAAVAEMKRLARETNARYVAQARSLTEHYVTRERPPIRHPVEVDFGPVKVIGYDVEPRRFEAGGKLVVTLYYEVVEPPPASWKPFLHVLGPKFINADHQPVDGAYPLSQWKKGDFIKDRHPVTTRPDWAVGDYEVLTGFTENKKRIDPIASSVPLRRKGTAHLTTVEMTKPVVRTEDYVFRQRPAIDRPVDVRLGDSIRLIGASIDKPEIKGGLKTTVTCVYEVLERPDPKLGFRVQLAGPRGKSFAHTPVSGTYPPSEWKAGEFIVDRIEIITHTRDRKGDYRVLLSLEEAAPKRRGARRAPVSGTGAPIENDQVEVGAYRIVGHASRH